jgi:hypothetical protein
LDFFDSAPRFGWLTLPQCGQFSIRRCCVVVTPVFLLTDDGKHGPYVSRSSVVARTLAQTSLALLDTCAARREFDFVARGASSASIDLYCPSIQSLTVSSFGSRIFPGSTLHSSHAGSRGWAGMFAGAKSEVAWERMALAKGQATCATVGMKREVP